MILNIWPISWAGSSQILARSSMKFWEKFGEKSKHRHRSARPLPASTKSCSRPVHKVLFTVQSTGHVLLRKHLPSYVTSTFLPTAYSSYWSLAAVIDSSVPRPRAHSIVFTPLQSVVWMKLCNINEIVLSHIFHLLPSSILIYRSTHRQNEFHCVCTTVHIHMTNIYYLSITLVITAGDVSLVVVCTQWATPMWTEDQ